MRKALVVALLAAAAVGTSHAAEGAAYSKTRVQVVENKKQKLVPVDLRFSGDRIILARRKGTVAPVEIPYASITGMSYEMAKRHRIEEGSVLMLYSLGTGAVLMATKTKSHWLAIEYKDDAGPRTAVLQLHKSEYGSVIQTAEASTGRKVEMLAASEGRINPTANSTNVEEALRYPPGRVRTALKTAMAKYGCEVTEDEASRVVCKRVRGRSEATGVGGEKITASLSPEGEGTRIVIETGKGFYGRMRKKNWSTPIYREMVKNLEAGS